MLPGIAGTVDDSDIVRFIPSQPGATTSGRFELFFDGSDVGLTTNDEDIDAIGVITANLQPESVGATNLPGGGQLMISTLGPASVPDASGEHEDLLVFNATSMGENASGSWELFYDFDQIVAYAAGAPINVVNPEVLPSLGHSTI